MRGTGVVLLVIVASLGVGCRRGAKPTNTVQPKISRPSDEDTERIARQWAVVAGLVQQRYGVALGRAEADLALLQRLVDEKVIAPEKTYELQCLGIALGEILAANSTLRWATVEDEYGRDPALQQPGTTVLVFPLTMISKRIEQGRDVPLRALYLAVQDQAKRMADDPEYKQAQ